jgi:hypothetical protein
MRRTRTPLVALGMFVLACLGGCASGGGSSHTRTDAAGAQAYQDPLGWTVSVPDGWLAKPFRLSEGASQHAGAEISNIRLPPPVAEPGTPVQTSGLNLPDRGVGVVIAADPGPTDSGDRVLTPPLTPSDLLEGSALGGAPSLETRWFSGDGRTFTVTVKTGAKASHADKTAACALITSIRFADGG